MPLCLGVFGDVGEVTQVIRILAGAVDVPYLVFADDVLREEKDQRSKDFQVAQRYKKEPKASFPIHKREIPMK